MAVPECVDEAPLTKLLRLAVCADAVTAVSFPVLPGNKRHVSANDVTTVFLYVISEKKKTKLYPLTLISTCQVDGTGPLLQTCNSSLLSPQS